MAFYDSPAEHSVHPRTTNPDESVFATLRHRTVRTQKSLSPQIARLLVFKLIDAGLENLASIEMHKSVAEDHRRCQVRRRGHSDPTKAA